MTQAGKRVESHMWELELRIKSRRFREGLEAAARRAVGPFAGRSTASCAT